VPDYGTVSTPVDGASAEGRTLPVTEQDSPAQRAAGDLAGALRAAASTSAAADLVSLADQVDQALVPRLGSDERPLLVVLGGSTGVGKSTLLNSLVGRRVSRAGVLRPTTRVPVLVHHPDDAPLIAGWPVTEHGTEVVADVAMPSGLAMLDSPDLDSVEHHNRVLATRLIDTADLWLAVTSASRYADAVPWQSLRRTAARQGTTAVVLNRVGALAVGKVSTHVATLMAGAGLGDSPLIVVSEHEAVDGVLPSEAVATLRRLIVVLAADPALRAAVRRSSVAGAVTDLVTRVEAAVAAHDGGVSDEVAELIGDALGRLVGEAVA
jgi:energy-coupling factor transporter ATP-binding protein EcfA2